VTNDIIIPGDAEVIVFYTAVCYDCGHDLVQPFLNRNDRTQWMDTHIKATGHTVTMATALRLREPHEDSRHGH
jgi:hypothetical protein